MRGGRTTINRCKLKEERCKLVTKVNFLTMMTGRQQGQLLGESVQAPSLEVFKTLSKVTTSEQVGQGATSKLGFKGSGSTLQHMLVPGKDVAPSREKLLYKYRIHSV